jgi:hypothetical protein
MEKKIHFYRGITIMKNSINNGYKWTTFEIDDIYSNSIDDMKNKIDKNLGGYATSKVPKRKRDE